MAQTIRVSLAGYNALTEANIYNYSLYADSDNVLIKEKARGSGNLAINTDVLIAHGLSYVPFYMTFGEVSSGRYRYCSSFTNDGPGWDSFVNTTNVQISHGSSPATTGYKYFIFYDNLT